FMLTSCACTSAFNIHKTIMSLCNICLCFSECLREDITFEKTEPVENASYADGETVKVNCVAGYTGLYKLKCEKGEWKKSIERPCARKKCSHPGDTPNGNFELKEGTEFVFGATVLYTCKKGYEMTSRINHRTCRAQGWDNAVPVCEGTISLKSVFPPFFLSPGETITFSCDGRGSTLQGQEKITCQSNGEWSSPFPKCIEATCPLQRITTEDLKIERHPDIEGPAKPEQKIIFSCTGQDLILIGQREVICQSNGEWSSPFPTCEGKSDREWSSPFPKCQTTSCGPPPDVNDADTIELKKEEYNTGERVEYSCFNKYTLDLRPPFSSYLTCVQGEWRGNIKCLKPCTVTVEEMNRRGIDLAYADRQKMFAPHNDHITFACQRGKVLAGDRELRQQCDDGVMTLPECVGRWG
uniref:Sushi domain-containing protein n=1 Tax=Cyprinus carpio TaxID=7962 RepID=A0A8C2KCR0_CYPCA